MEICFWVKEVSVYASVLRLDLMNLIPKGDRVNGVFRFSYLLEQFV